MLPIDSFCRLIYFIDASPRNMVAQLKKRLLTIIVTAIYRSSITFVPLSVVYRDGHGKHVRIAFSSSVKRPLVKKQPAVDNAFSLARMA